MAAASEATSASRGAEPGPRAALLGLSGLPTAYIREVLGSRLDGDDDVADHARRDAGMADVAEDIAQSVRGHPESSRYVDLPSPPVSPGLPHAYLAERDESRLFCAEAHAPPTHVDLTESTLGNSVWGLLAGSRNQRRAEYSPPSPSGLPDAYVVQQEGTGTRTASSPPIAARWGENAFGWLSRSASPAAHAAAPTICESVSPADPAPAGGQAVEPPATLGHVVATTSAPAPDVEPDPEDAPSHAPDGTGLGVRPQTLGGVPVRALADSVRVLVAQAAPPTAEGDTDTIPRCAMPPTVVDDVGQTDSRRARLGEEGGPEELHAPVDRAATGGGLLEATPTIGKPLVAELGPAPARSSPGSVPTTARPSQSPPGDAREGTAQETDEGEDEDADANVHADATEGPASGVEAVVGEATDSGDDDAEALPMDATATAVPAAAPCSRRTAHCTEEMPDTETGQGRASAPAAGRPSPRPSGESCTPPSELAASPPRARSLPRRQPREVASTFSRRKRARAEDGQPHPRRYAGKRGISAAPPSAFPAATAPDQNAVAKRPSSSTPWPGTAPKRRRVPSARPLDGTVCLVTKLPIDTAQGARAYGLLAELGAAVVDLDPETAQLKPAVLDGSGPMRELADRARRVARDQGHIAVDQLVLISPKGASTLKFYWAVAAGILPVTPAWLEACARAKAACSPAKFIAGAPLRGQAPRLVDTTACSGLGRLARRAALSRFTAVHAVNRPGLRATAPGAWKERGAWERVAVMAMGRVAQLPLSPTTFDWAAEASAIGAGPKLVLSQNRVSAEELRVGDGGRACEVRDIEWLQDEVVTYAGLQKPSGCGNPAGG